MYVSVQRGGNLVASTFPVRGSRRRPSTIPARLAGRGVGSGVPWFFLPGLGSTLTLPFAGSVPVTSGFGTRTAPLPGGSTNHAGIDYGVPSGTAVLAAGDGVVTFAGVQQGYGNVVQIDNGGGLSTLYAHLSSIGVGVGQTVSDGQQIALSGATGDVTGPHLHFGVYQNGVAVDPTQYLSDSAMLDPSFDLSSVFDLGASGDNLSAALSAPDLSTAAAIVGNDPVLLVGGAVLGGLLLWTLFG